MNGLFGSLFDWNGNGVLDPCEKSTAFWMANEWMAKDQEADAEYSDWDAGEYDE